MRSVGGVIYCEQCLAARLGLGGAPKGGGAPPPVGVMAPGGPNPAAAFALGFIPGVGAMYNGQFIKGLVHVVIFIILIGITEHLGIFGILIAAWVAYQVFDAYETAKARRDGRPLPDPFGLNDFGAKMGIPMGGPGSAGPWVGGPGSGGPGVAQGFTGGHVPPPGAVNPPPPPVGYADPYAAPPVPPVGPSGGYGRREPIGAIVLIGLGVLFLLNSLDIFHFNWFGRLWPLLIIGFGVALFIRRSREVPPPPPPPAGGAQ
ncbi:MAG: DUF5668 domain-containing protein [Acidobacteriaceae bacterium]